MARRLSRRSVLGTSGALVLAAGCLDGNPGEGRDDGDDLRSTPDRILWRAEVHEAEPDERERSYPPDHDSFDGFEPLEDLLAQIEEADELSGGDRFLSDFYPYGEERTDELLDQWNEIRGEDGFVDVLMEHGDLYFLLWHIEEHDE